MKKYTHTPSGVKLVSVASTTLLIGGGAMALLGKEIAVTFADADVTGFSADIGADEAFVAVHPRMAAAMREIDPRFLEAIVLHEEGHCLFGHCHVTDGQEMVILPNGAEIINHLESEFQADAHAASVVGGEVMVAAMTAAIDFTVELIVDQFTSEQLEGIRRQIMESVKPRLDALVG